MQWPKPPTPAMQRVLTIALYVSTALILLIVALFIVGPKFDIRSSQISLGAGVVSSKTGGSLVVFNDANDGPYLGSTLGIAGAKNGPSVEGFGEFAGIYYRKINWPNGKIFWTASISLLWPLFASVSAAMFFGGLKLKYRRHASNSAGFPL